MQYSTKEKNYGDSQQTGKSGLEGLAGGKTGNVGLLGQNAYSGRTPDKKQGSDSKRPNIIDTPKNQELFQSFPQLNINRVDSAQHREKLKTNAPSGTSYIGLTNSMIDRPVHRGDSRTTSTSVDKTGNNPYLNPRETNMYSSSQYATNKPAYQSNYPTYRRESNNLAPNYNYGDKSDDGSDNQVPTYKRITNVMTMQRMDMEINPKMVSSVISRESNGKQNSTDKNGKVYQSSSSRNKDSKKGDDEPYEQLYASRHPEQSIRKSTIQISKAISSNAITQLQRTNENQKKQIKLLQKQLDQIKGSLKKYDEIKHRYQMDLQSKSRQIFDLERANKRLSQQVQGIRAYRTMDTVQQVIIVRLKEQIMQLNKKIIEMQAQHYKNQKMFLEKHQKKDSSKADTDTDKQAFKKLEQSFIMSKRQNELLSAQLQKQKQKAWNLQREKQQYTVKQTIDRESNDRQLQAVRKQISTLRVELQMQSETIRSKDTLLDQKLKEQQKNFDVQISRKLAQKQQQYKAKLNEEMRLYESKIVQQGKNQKLKQNEQRTQIQSLRKQKQQIESQLKQKISQVEQNFQQANRKLAEKDTVINNQYLNQINNLKQALRQNQNYIRDLQNENKKVVGNFRAKESQVEKLKSENLKIVEDMSREVKQKSKWKQQETYIIQQTVRAELEEQVKKKQKQLQVKAATITALEQSVNQMKVKFEQQKQQQAVKVQAQLKQKQQKLQTQIREKQQSSIKQLEVTKVKLTEEVKKVQLNLVNINKELAAVTSRKSQFQSQVTVKQRQVKDIQQKLVEIKAQVQAKTTQAAQIENQKKQLSAQTQKLKVQSEKEKSSSKELEAKLASVTAELNTIKSQYAKIEQKSKLVEVQLARATQNTNTWKSKSQSLQNTLDQQRTEFKLKIAESEGSKVKVEIVKKYQELLPQYELLKQKLKLKEQEIVNRENAFTKVRHSAESGDTKVANLLKQIKHLTTKVDETQTKFKSILSKVELDETKYKELLDKMSKNSEVYLAFIKKLQEDNQLIAQKYWKIRKLVKKQKITDEHDLLEKHDYSTFKKYMEHDVMTHFNKVIIPAFETRILQRLSAHETNLVGKIKRLGQVKALAQYIKRRRQAEKAKVKN